MPRGCVKNKDRRSTSRGRQEGWDGEDRQSREMPWDNRIRNTVAGSKRSVFLVSLTLIIASRQSLFPHFLHPFVVFSSNLSLRFPSQRSPIRILEGNEGITSNYKKLSADQIRDGGVLITTQKSGLDQLKRGPLVASYPVNSFSRYVREDSTFLLYPFDRVHRTMRCPFNFARLRSALGID